MRTAFQKCWKRRISISKCLEALNSASKSGLRNSFFWPAEEKDFRVTKGPAQWSLRGNIEMIGLFKYPLGFWVSTDCPLHDSFTAVAWSFCLSFMTQEQNSFYCLALVLLEPLSPSILVSCGPYSTSPVWPICLFLTMAISTRVLTSTAYRVAFPSRIS